MRRLPGALAVLAAFTLGLAVAWSAGAHERCEQAALREVRAAGTREAWSAFLAAHPANHEAQAWVAALAAPVALPAPSPAIVAPASRETRLRQEIARLEALFTIRSAAAAAAVKKQKAVVQRSPAARLAVAPLPPAPTAVEVDAYLLAVQRRLQPVTRYAETDPDIDLLRAVPSAFLDQLLEAAHASQVGGFRQFALLALPDIVTVEQQEVVLRWLPRLPALISVVERREWQEAALPILRERLAKVQDLSAQVRWVHIIGGARDRADYPLLQAVILANKYGYWQRDLCLEVAGLPEFPLRETVTACWAARQKVNGSSAFLPLAAEYGAYDALARIVACTTVREPHCTTAMAEAWLTARSNAPDEPQRLIRWLGSAEDPPAYDAETRRWHRELPPVPGF